MTTAVDEVLSLYPWAAEIGLVDLITQGVIDGDSSEEMVARIRESAPYKERFPAMNFGVFRNERDYLDRENDYRTVLIESGFYDASTDNPMDYVGFMEQGVTPDVLRERTTVYRNLEAGSQELRDAFYVYAGLDVSVDDLFQAVVDKQYGQRLAQSYNDAVATGSLDSPTYYKRIAETTIKNAVNSLSGSEDFKDDVQSIMNTDINQATELVAALDMGTTETLTFSELSYAFQYALLGSSATEQGLIAPDKEMAERLRQAGVDRAKASAVYGTFASNRGAIQGAVQRATQGAVQEFNQRDFEEGALLGQREELDLLQRAQAMEQAYSRRGGFATQQEGKRFTQRGRTGY